MSHSKSSEDMCWVNERKHGRVRDRRRKMFEREGEGEIIPHCRQGMVLDVLLSPLVM